MTADVGPAARRSLPRAIRHPGDRPGLDPVRVRLLRLMVAVALTGVVVTLWDTSDAGDAAPPPVAASISVPSPEIQPDALLGSAGGTGPVRVEPGSDIVRGPPEQADPQRPRSFARYIVQPGDTVHGISLVYDVEIDDILQYNPALDDGNRIAVGQQVLVPQFNK